jgi:hypothetical protein
MTPSKKTSRVKVLHEIKIGQKTIHLFADSHGYSYATFSGHNKDGSAIYNEYKFYGRLDAILRAIAEQCAKIEADSIYKLIERFEYWSKKLIEECKGL